MGKVIARSVKGSDDDDEQDDDELGGGELAHLALAGEAQQQDDAEEDGNGADGEVEEWDIGEKKMVPHMRGSRD